MFSINRNCYYLVIFFIFLFLFCTCDHGLKPAEENQSQKSEISGTISYINWPPADSLYDLRLVVFRRYPPGDIFGELGEGRAHVYPAIGQDGLPLYVDTTAYVMELDPGYYKYVAVAQQYGSNPFADWLAAGQYDTLLTDDLPTPINVISGELLEEINIQVDFDDLPPQPF
jgi:hypothetical protein